MSDSHRQIPDQASATLPQGTTRRRFLKRGGAALLAFGVASTVAYGAKPGSTCSVTGTQPCSTVGDMGRINSICDIWTNNTKGPCQCFQDLGPWIGLVPAGGSRLGPCAAKAIPVH